MPQSRGSCIKFCSGVTVWNWDILQLCSWLFCFAWFLCLCFGVFVTLNHFFRSHRSSTLDFRFLSHYSYIKAIMLYKGTTWQDSGILWHTLAYSGVLWHTLAYSCILWHTLAYFGILLHTLAYYCILWHTVQYRAIPCNTVQYRAIPCNNMQYHAIPCFTMQYHAPLITADGAYHCPVGSIWLF